MIDQDDREKILPDLPLMLSSFPDDLFMLVDRIEVECIEIGDHSGSWAHVPDLDKWWSVTSVDVDTDFGFDYTAHLFFSAPTKTESALISVMLTSGHRMFTLRVKRVFCKAGIVLKSKEDIGNYFFDEFNPKKYSHMWHCLTEDHGFMRYNYGTDTNFTE